jgi:hypothetical protein
MKTNKGILLVIATVVMAVVSVLTGVYLSSLVTEKRSFDTARGVLQALNLAEAGANMAYAELRKRIPGDINPRIGSEVAANLAAYVDGNNPLGFLRNYAYAVGATQFSVAGGKATLTFSLPSISMGIEGSGTATITITSRSAPTKDASDGPFRFFYTFNIEATGSITRYNPALQKTVAYSPNNFDLIVQHLNFARYALFTSHHHTPAGTTVWFTANTNFTGPVHTDERFSFANNPSAHFADLVTQSLATANFYNNGNTKQADASAYPVNCTTGCTDKPTFDNGFLRSQPIINLPTSVTQNQMRDDARGTFTPPSNGIWLPNSGSCVNAGIYIQGDTGSSADNPTITMSVDASNRQVYNITRGSNTKTIVINATSNQTIISGSGTGTTNGTYCGVPNGTGHEGIIIYTNDDVGYWDTGHHPTNIAGLSGTVQEDTKMTVASEKDLMITGNITYQRDPLIPGNEGYNNMLGAISWNGNVRIGTDAPNNVTIKGVIMAPNPLNTTGVGIFTVDDYDHGSPRGTAALLGGIISDYYGAFGTFSGNNPSTGYGRNFTYDQRVLNGTTPPYFPYLSGYGSNPAPADVFSTRTSWREKEG